MASNGSSRHCSYIARWEDIISKWLVFEKGEQAYKAVLTDDKFGESLNLSLSSGMWLVSAHGVNEAGKQIDTTPCRLTRTARPGGVDGDAPLLSADRSRTYYLPPTTQGE